MKRQVESSQREVIIYELYLGDITSLTGHNKVGLNSGEDSYPNAHSSLAVAKATLPDGMDIKNFISGLADKQLVSAKLKRGLNQATEDDRWQISQGSGTCSLPGYDNAVGGEVDQLTCTEQYGKITVDGTLIYLNWTNVEPLYGSNNDSFAMISNQISNNGGYCATPQGEPDWGGPHGSQHTQNDCTSNGGTWVSTSSSTVVATSGTWNEGNASVILKSNQILEIVLKEPFAQEPIIFTNTAIEHRYYLINGVETKFPSGTGSASNPIKLHVNNVSYETPILIIGSKIADKY